MIKPWRITELNPPNNIGGHDYQLSKGKLKIHTYWNYRKESQDIWYKIAPDSKWIHDNFYRVFY